MGQNEAYYLTRFIENFTNAAKFKNLISAIIKDIARGTKIDVCLPILTVCKNQAQHAWVVNIPTQDLGTLLEQIPKPKTSINQLKTIIQNYHSRLNILYLRKSRESQVLACELDVFLGTAPANSNTLSDCSALFAFELFHILKTYMETYGNMREDSSNKILYQQLLPIYKEIDKSLGKLYPLYQVYYQKGDGQYSALIRAARVIKAYENDQRCILQKSSESLDLINGESGLKQTLEDSLGADAKEKKLLDLYNHYAPRNRNRTFCEAFAPVKQDLQDTEEQRKSMTVSYS